MRFTAYSPNNGPSFLKSPNDYSLVKFVAHTGILFWGKLARMQLSPINCCDTHQVRSGCYLLTSHPWWRQEAHCMQGGRRNARARFSRTLYLVCQVGDWIGVWGGIEGARGSHAWRHGLTGSAWQLARSSWTRAYTNWNWFEFTMPPTSTTEDFHYSGICSSEIGY